ncbi:hypothetical protein B0H13DRAFT_1902790 [Mycena leptocephala]|nr:hypothetical protein B0H13DRAFT_1902790 [Mycena leptocephala]
MNRASGVSVGPNTQSKLSIYRSSSVDPSMGKTGTILKPVLKPASMSTSHVIFPWSKCFNPESTRQVIKQSFLRINKQKLNLPQTAPTPMASSFGYEEPIRNTCTASEDVMVAKPEDIYSYGHKYKARKYGIKIVWASAPGSQVMQHEHRGAGAEIGCSELVRLGTGQDEAEVRIITPKVAVLIGVES